MSRHKHKITIFYIRRKLSLFYLILIVQNNTYNEETFNVTNTSTAWTAGLRKLTLVCQGGPEIWAVNLWTVSLWFKGQQFPDVLMKPAKRKAPITHNAIYNNTNTTTLAIAATTIFKTCC